MAHFLSRFIKTDVRVFLGIGLFVLVAYSPMLNSPFKTLDDDFSIVLNPDIRSLRHIPELFTKTYFKSAKDFYRPLVYVSYTVEYKLFRLNYFYYNLDNVLIHIINAFLVFLLALALMNDRLRAFLAAFLFAVHPVQWEAVATVPGRAILLCSLFILGAWLFFVRFAKDQRPRDLLGTTLCFALGLLCKESAGVFILGAGFYWLLIARRSMKGLLRLWPLAVIAAGYIAIRHAMDIVSVFPWRDLPSMAMGVLSFLYGVLTYIRIFFLPVDLHFDRGQWVFKSVAEPAFWATLAVYAAALGLFVRRFRTIAPFVLFLLGWFWIELFPVSQIVTSIGVYPGAISLAEHFVYFASIPVFLLIVSGGAWLGGRVRERKVLTLASGSIVVAAFFLFCWVTLYQQAIYAGNELLLVKQTLAYEPKNARAEYSLAMIYAKTRKFDEAIAAFKKATELYPCNPNFHVALGKAWADKGDHLQAVRVYETIPSRKDINAVLDGLKQRSYSALVLEYESLRLAEPKNAEVLFALGVFYSKLSRHPKAYDAFAAAWAVDHTRFDALFNMGVTAQQTGELVRARAAFGKLVRAAAPDNAFRKQAEQILKADKP